MSTSDKGNHLQVRIEKTPEGDGNVFPSPWSSQRRNCKNRENSGRRRKPSFLPPLALFFCVRIEKTPEGDGNMFLFVNDLDYAA